MSKQKNQMIELIKSLSDNDKKSLVNEIMAMLGNEVPNDNRNDNSCAQLVQKHAGEKPDCPHCGAKAQLGNIVKKGYRANGAQRFYCKSCGHNFVSTTNTAFAYTRKDSDTWEKFIYLTITGESLHTCAEECHIAYQTAFTWRHKILNVFKTHQEKETNMSGKIEIDEMLIPLSFKGNHIKGKNITKRKVTLETIRNNNGLPREPLHRGSDNKSTSSKDKACVFCMVQDGNKAFYGSVPGVGFMLNPMLDHTLAKHVDKENAVILADQYKITRNYLNNNNYDHMILAANTSDNVHDHKPEIRGEYHLQHVNSMHGHIRAFLRKYFGVSSKYLDNYIALFVWLKNQNAKQNRNKIQNISISRASMSDCYINRKTLESYPAIPSCE